MFKYARRFVVNIRSLFTAFSLFRLRGGNLIYFQIIYPSLVTASIFLIYNKWGKQWLDIDVDQVVSSATTLMGVLVGFYIAALAAVTSFPNEHLDNPMAGRSTTLIDGSGKLDKQISRRRFLSILLGYCAFMSILIFLAGSFSAAISVKATYHNLFVSWLATGYSVVYTWMISSLGIITLLCLHYLIDRMHRE